jgi:RND family efflux transporter MFP subunit
VVTVTGSGQVSAAQSSSVTTKATGVVAKTLVKDGDTVKMDQPLMQLELDMTGKLNNSQAYASYQSAKNALSSAQTNLYSLQSKLFAANQKFINDAAARDLEETDPTYIQQNADWLAAENTYKQQQEVIAQAQTALSSAWMSYQTSSATVYAPISGVVSGLALQKGSVITNSSDTGTAIANIVTDALPIVTLNLTEVDIPKVAIGNKATVTVDALTDISFTGKVISIDKSGVTSSGVTTYPTAIQLDTNSDKIYPNMAISASIITEMKTDVVMVPSAAVQTQDGSSFVRVMKDGKIDQVSVETGISSDSQTEIVSGISEGDNVVTSFISSQARKQTQTSSPFGMGAMTGSRGMSTGGNVRVIQK